MKTLAITMMMMIILIVPLLVVVVISITVNSNNANAAGYTRLSEQQLQENRGFRGPTLSTSSEPVHGPALGTASP
jgi:ABC-type spermidine/putrescine transport system permease subunit II